MIFCAVLLTGIQLVSYSRMRGSFPPKTTIAGISVGGLTQQQAADRISQVYSLPVEVQYQNQTFQIYPSMAGFSIDLEGMLTAADIQRLDQPFWDAFWDYLWGVVPQPNPVPLRASISNDRLKQYLQNEIQPRYDIEPIPAASLSGSPIFQPGTPGTQIDLNRSIYLLEDAFFSPTNRSTALYYVRVDPPRPSYDHLRVLLQRNLEVSGFDGLAEIYFLDLNTRQEIHFAVRNGEELPPDVAFTAASTMKIPIMVTTYVEQEFPLNPALENQIELMIEQSENTPADRLMDAIDGNVGPLAITETMQALGFTNTFIAGFYYPGAPLLQRFTTTANSRSDVNVNPDIYNQTVSSEIGMLLDDIYQCAENGGGTFAVVFPGQITQAECQQMLSILANNRIGVLLQAGLPDGTRIAHKHGWITEADGLIRTISDVGIIYSPGGNYILCIHLWRPTQLGFDNANLLFADLSKLIYNFVNLE